MLCTSYSCGCSPLHPALLFKVDEAELVASPLHSALHGCGPWSTSPTSSFCSSLHGGAATWISTLLGAVKSCAAFFTQQLKQGVCMSPNAHDLRLQLSRARPSSLASYSVDEAELVASPLHSALHGCGPWSTSPTSSFCSSLHGGAATWISTLLGAVKSCAAFFTQQLKQGVYI